MKRFSFGVALQYLVELLPYLKVTFLYTAGALLIGIVFGFLFALMKLGGNRVLKALAAGYTAVMRSVPSIVLIFLVYYGLPALAKAWFGISIAGLDKVYFVMLALGLFSIASMSEIMKSAYLSVNKGQYEAAVSNGMPAVQAVLRITVPQAFRIALPNFGNTLAMLLKEGSLGYTIGLIDIMGQATHMNALSYGNDVAEIFLTLAAIYWAISILIDQLFKLLERQFSYGLNQSRTLGKQIRMERRSAA